VLPAQHILHDMHVLIVDDMALIRERLGGVQADIERRHVCGAAAWLARSRPDTPVLHVTGYADDAIVCRGMLKPVLAFLHKPFTPDALARKVRELPEAS
jgi:DNA-binding NarL/FixJ family response regulator